jgi:lecithin-cholesterol acyltransferase
MARPPTKETKRKRISGRIRVVVAVLILLAFSSLPAAAQVPQGNPSTPRLTPVVLFPGWGGTRLEVRVRNQSVAPECPQSATFEYTLFAPPSEFSQVCQDKLLTLVYDLEPQNAERPVPRVSAQRGVKVSVADYGKAESTPLCEPLYAFLERAGYVRNVNIRTAGYDFRLTPDMGGFMERTTALIEETYRQNHNTPVHLAGHSNGPLYAQYLLTHTSRQWKDKYIHGFTPIAGNWPGQGWLYTMLFTGFNVPTASHPTDSTNAATSVAMYESHPSTYMSASDPAYFGDREVVIRVGPGGREYTPQDYQELFEDAGLTLAQEIAPYYLGFVKFQPPFFPYVDVYAEMGSGLPTVVGLELPDLTLGQLVGPTTGFITRDGDSNQEDITNEAVRVWKDMPCYHFELNDNPGVDHMSLAVASTEVWERLLMHLQQPRSECPRK